MSQVFFTEYGSGSGEVQLYVIIWAAADDDLQERLLDLTGCTGVDLLGDGMLAIRAAPLEDTDDFLRRTAELVDESGAWIVESRLCPSTGGGYEPVEISDKFTVLAVGVDCALKPAHNYLFLEPGTAFGSGRHPSTRLAVQALQELTDQGDFSMARVLDIGCGSGILSLVCARLGASSVLGLDISLEAVALARKNVILNGGDDKIEIDDSSLQEIDQRFDILVANISPFILLGVVIPNLPRLLAPNGQIVLAGMRLAQLGGLRQALSAVGLRGREKIYEEGLWRGLWLDTR